MSELSEFKHNEFNMNQFLLDLAKAATLHRFNPFPNDYREKSEKDTPPTEDEFKHLQQVLHSNEIPDNLMYFITHPKLNIVQHANESVANITEFEFKYPTYLESIRNIKYPKRYYLYHGSPLQNWYSIINNGIKNMSNTSLMSTGAVLGPGVYLTNNLNTAIAYGISQLYSIVAVVEIIVNYKTYEKTETVFVIPDDTLLFPRYLLKIYHPKNVIASSEQLLLNYENRRNVLTSNTIKKNRVKYDIKQISPTAIFQYDEDTQIATFEVQYVKFRCYINSYPTSPPLIQLVNKLKKECCIFDTNGIYIEEFTNWTSLRDFNYLMEFCKDLVVNFDLFVKNELNEIIK